MPKQCVAPPPASERARRFVMTVLQHLRRVDRRLWPVITAVLGTLLTVLVVLVNIAPATVVFGMLLVIRPLLFGCALWLGYECIRHLLLTRVRRD